MKRICIVTGSRSEWGLLELLAIKIKREECFHLDIVATGSHLSPTFGYTVCEIEKVQKPETVEILLSSDSAVGTTKSMGLALISFAEVYERLKPDCVIVLGDRYEILAAATAAYIARVPITHLHGGETTEGSLDDAFRHSITHMATYHFPATEKAAQMVRLLCGKPVSCVGAIGCDGLMKREQGKKYNRFVLLVHSETKGVPAIGNCDIICTIIDRCLAKEVTIIGPNADHGAHEIIRRWGKKGFVFGEQVGRARFLEHCLSADALIGNSSAGIIEMPALGVPSINIGKRQKGREMADSIIQCPSYDKKNLETAFDRLESQEFKDIMATDYYTPYKGGNVAERITEKLKEI